MGVNSRTLTSKKPPLARGVQRLSLARDTTAGAGTAAADRAARDHHE
jgi:hypothetical protein